MDKNIKIMCIFHNDVNEIPEEISDTDIYIPIFGGKSRYHGRNVYMKMMLGDNTGDNISQLNNYINEVSVMYWTWKHYEEIGNPDYIGFNHYKRFIIWNNDDLDDNTILAHKIVLDESIYDQYAKNHVKGDIDAFNRYFLNLVPEKYTYCYNKFLKQNDFYNNNMFIMPKKLFFEFMEFMDYVIKIMKIMISDNTIDIDNRDVLQKRAHSYILERVVGYWIYMKEQNGIKVKNTERICKGCC